MTELNFSLVNSNGTATWDILNADGVLVAEVSLDEHMIAARARYARLRDGKREFGNVSGRFDLPSFRSDDDMVRFFLGQLPVSKGFSE